MTAPIDASRCLSVVMPVYNEGRTVLEIIERVLAQPEVAELIIVNDCSSDDTWSVLQEIAPSDSRLRALHAQGQPRQGRRVAHGIFQGDGAHRDRPGCRPGVRPHGVSAAVAPILSGRADVVFGSRFLGAEAHRVLYYWHSVGNYFLTMLSNMLSNLNLTDMETCYKAFRREIIQQIRIEENRFGFEPEITAKVAHIKPSLRIYEVAVSYYGRTYEEGKKIGWRDGVSALIAILRYNLFRP